MQHMYMHCIQHAVPLFISCRQINGLTVLLLLIILYWNNSHICQVRQIWIFDSRGSAVQRGEIVFCSLEWDEYANMLTKHSYSNKINFFHINKLENAETGGTSGPTRICTVFMHTLSPSIFRRAEISQWQEILNWKISEKARTGYFLYATYLQVQQGMTLEFVLSSSHSKLEIFGTSLSAYSSLYVSPPHNLGKKGYIFMTLGMRVKLLEVNPILHYLLSFLSSVTIWQKCEIQKCHNN